MPAAKKKTTRPRSAKTAAELKDKSLEFWIWDVACSIRGAKDASKYKDLILPLIFTKRLCDVFDDDPDSIASEIGSRKISSASRQGRAQAPSLPPPSRTDDREDPRS